LLFVFLSAGASLFEIAPVIAAAMAAGCEPAARAAGVEEDTSFVVVALPDTQYYVASHPEILEAQARWIVTHREAANIALVVHEGDIVDADEPWQWERAARSLHLLDGVVPYLLSAGNHDYRREGTAIVRDTHMNDYFPPAGFAGTTWFGGTFEPGHIEDSFAIVGTPGGPWLVLSLEFGPRDAALAWADGIVKRYSSLPAMIVTHAYLNADDTRYDHLSRPDQAWNPYRYLSATPAGGINDGEEMWRKLIARNDNVMFVLCGHDLGDGVGRLTSVRADGSRAHQILANYQMQPLGGEGYLRLMTFFPAQRRVAVRTYSPYRDRFKTDAGNDFDLEY
jgi:hypothetical protein